MIKRVLRTRKSMLTVSFLGIVFVALAIGSILAWPVKGRDGRIPRDTVSHVDVVGENSRFYALPSLAKDAARAGDFDEAQRIAEELLALAPGFPHNWNYGNAIHDANVALGLAAISRGDANTAKSHLLSAGQAGSSPQLATFGPNMMLAKALLVEGETDAVIEYFELCRSFWEMENGRLDRWSAEVSEGKVPSFGVFLHN